MLGNIATRVLLSSVSDESLQPIDKSLQPIDKGLQPADKNLQPDQKGPQPEEHRSQYEQPGGWRKNRHSPKRHKQVARIIKHLRHEVEEHYPHLALPTTWMIDCLIHNCPSGLLQPTIHPEQNNEGRTDWHGAVTRALAYIAGRTAGSNDRKIAFVRPDGSPLFPNHELFDQQDAHLFSQTLLKYLAQGMD